MKQQLMLEEAMKEIRAKLKEYNKDGRYKSILTQVGDNVLYADEALDITDDFTALNEHDTQRPRLRSPPNVVQPLRSPSPPCGGGSAIHETRARSLVSLPHRETCRSRLCGGDSILVLISDETPRCTRHSGG